MSVVLSVYSQSAYKEFVLPAIHNAETVLVLDRKIFHLREDLELRLEVVDEKWSFLPSPNLRIQAAEGVRGDLRLKNQANYRIESVRGEVLSTIVQIKPTSFCNYRIVPRFWRFFAPWHPERRHPALTGASGGFHRENEFFTRVSWGFTPISDWRFVTIL